MDTDKKKFDGLRQIGLATTIPFMMVSGPLVGYFIGNWLDNKFDTAPYLVIFWIFLGLISSARESYKLLKQVSDDSKDDDDDVRT